MEPFEGNPLDFTHFISMFQESFEKKIDEPQYGNLHTMFSSYRKEIKLVQHLKPGTFETLETLFNFLIKCQTMGVDSQYNLLDTPEIICMILAKLPLHLHDRWNRNTLLLRRRDSREPTAVLQINIICLLVTMNRKIKKNTSQIKFLEVTIKQWVKVVLQHSLCK